MRKVMAKRKNPAAVALGRLGGKAKANKPKGLAALTPEKRQEIASKGGKAKADKKD
jgi:general stress protein YciG